MKEGKRRRPRISFETRLTLLALAAGFPAIGASFLILWLGGYSGKVQVTVMVLLTGIWLGCAFALRERLIRPLQTVSNLLAALQEGDYSIRARGSREMDALDEVYREVNLLSQTLQEQRLGALEATALLRTVMAEIDVAVFTFDEENRLRLVNRAGETLLGMPAERMLGRSAVELGLEDCLEGASPRAVARSFPAGAGRWGIRLGAFREGGLPHRLLVIEDLTRTLREEELQAWKRLVRVMGHELNNSLAPIRSIAGSLSKLIEREPPPPDWREDAQRGLNVIAGRTEALTRFMESYARLARLPAPNMTTIRVQEWTERVAGLETRVPVRLEQCEEASVRGDGDQLDQLLINLVRNGADASAETGGEVSIGWQRRGKHLEVWVRDQGHGLTNTANLFVPFFTTKPGGSGIGLVLCRQIAEAHGGDLELRNREETRGCEALLRLPG
ncbi:MAG: PAS domain S-box protein [Acidimicrobiia bacterium]|nr:PAS domain S-box protein [Acidimicrobiia bacterium]